MMLLAPGFSAGARVAAWDQTRFVIPEGLNWFVVVVPIDPGAARVAQGAMLFFAALAMLGLRARLMLLGLTLSAFYLFSIAQLTGFVWHDMHLLWFCAVLALSPCADVLALDAHFGFDREGREYALPLLVVRLLFGVIYFFPGFRKLHVSGLDWIFSDNLQNQLYWKWLQHGSVPGFRIDQVPFALQAGGIFVVLFELGFVFLVLFRRTRPALVVCGVAFHLMTEAIFRIPFASLWLCYVAVVDLRPVGRRLQPWFRTARNWMARVRSRRSVDSDAETGNAVAAAEADSAGARATRHETAVAPGSAASRSSAGIAFAILAAAAVQGARGQMNSYPFACYPTFEWRAAATMPDLGMVAVLADGKTRQVPHARNAAGYRTQRQWAELWSLAGVYGPASKERLRAYVKSALRNAQARRSIEEAVAVRVYRDSLSVRPEDHGSAPRGRVALLEIRLKQP
jgi:hypothetical protein